MQDLFITSFVTGSILSVVNHTFDKKTEALTAAQDIIQQLEIVRDWREEKFLDIENIDTGGSYQALQSAVALTAGFLVEISFTFKQERSIILTKQRTIIDLCAELYGNIDDETLNFFITSNDLSGSEILEIQKGKEIVYYI